MNCKVLKIGGFALTAISTLLIMSCSSTQPFQLETAQYQSWQQKEMDRGTNIKVKLSNVKRDVQFDSLVFNHQLAKISRTDSANFTFLEGNIFQNSYQLDQNQHTLAENGIIYHSKEKKNFFKIDKFIRNEMKYYNVK